MSTINAYPQEASQLTVFAAGACAALAVDSTLFPLDTIKTRLQTIDGFKRSGGFSKLYSGIGPVLGGSMPGGALFFLTYEGVLHSKPLQHYSPTTQAAVAGPLAECVACVVRVPVELIKQRMQVTRVPLQEAAFKVYQEGGSTWWGSTRVLYRGYAATATREVPFALIQMTLLEHFKCNLGWSDVKAGVVAGSISGAITTPMDVVKTRLMTKSYAPSALMHPTSALFLTLGEVKIAWAEGGLRGLFRGGLTRSMWMGAGGGVFFGTFGTIKTFLQ